MPAISEYIMQITSAIVTPNDHSGEGVWNPSEDIPVKGTQRNEHYAFDNIAIAKPEGLSNLRSQVVEIEGQQYKCAPTNFHAWEHDEQATFADTLAGKEGRDMELTIRGWGVDETGRSVNLETRQYWVKLINSERIEFGVFAACITRINETGDTEPTKYGDFSKGNAKLIETPAGRLQSMETTSQGPRQLARGSAELIQQQLLEV